MGFVPTTYAICNYQHASLERQTLVFLTCQLIRLYDGILVVVSCSSFPADARLTFKQIEPKPQQVSTWYQIGLPSVISKQRGILMLRLPPTTMSQHSSLSFVCKKQLKVSATPVFPVICLSARNSPCTTCTGICTGALHYFI